MIAALACQSSASGQTTTGQTTTGQTKTLPADILRLPETVQALSYKFAEADESLLDDIQRGCFLYLWNEVGQPSGLVKDRLLANVCSVAGVGFQLSALPIGVERGWITREQGAERARTVLASLAKRTDNRKNGVLLHFVDLETGGPLPDSHTDQASTIDHALFLAGALPAAEYFGGEVAELVAAFVRETNWKWYDVSERGFISFGWRPEQGDLSGPGDFRPHDWHLASDEERIMYFLAAGAPNPDFAGDPRDYYNLQRHVKSHDDLAPFVVSWNGSMFTYLFAHLWIDYRRFDADQPRAFGVEAPRVDWLENSRRAVLAHRRRCIQASHQFGTLAEDRWGFAPCTGRDEQGRSTYLVQGLKPNVMDADEWQGGSVAPYAAGSAIMFTPQESMAALRAYRSLMDDKGKPLAWREPEQYGLVDSFNLDQMHASDDHVAIDAGPLLLAIENVRSGLIWKLFMQSETSERAVQRLGWTAAP